MTSHYLFISAALAAIVFAGCGQSTPREKIPSKTSISSINGDTLETRHYGDGTTSHFLNGKAISEGEIPAKFRDSKMDVGGIADKAETFGDSQTLGGWQEFR